MARTSHYVRSKVASQPEDARGAKASGAQLVYSRIHKAILEGRLKPGARITEAGIGKEIGLSRTPIREAIRQLEARGLLVHEPHRGMVIPISDHQMVTELYQVREALEGTAAATAAMQASPAEVELLREILDAGRRGGEAPAELVRNNTYFHNTMYRAAHNRYLLRTLAALQDSLMLLGRSTLSLKGRAAAAFDEHEAIVAAIAASDTKAAEAAARLHIRAAHRARLQLLFETEMGVG